MTKWWNIAGWPTPEEWQAFASVVGILGTMAAVVGAIAAVMAAFLAGRQLVALIRSNEELSRTNELAAASNMELTRPFVVVELVFHRYERRRPSPKYEGSLQISVSNSGATPARNLRVTTSPDLQSSMMDLTSTAQLPAEAAIRDTFNGTRLVSLLTAAMPLKYKIDALPNAMEDPELPTRYEVQVSYSNQAETAIFSDSFVLDLEPWKYAVQSQNYGHRISKDLQALDETLRNRL
jgi:hypothetical protein